MNINEWFENNVDFRYKNTEVLDYKEYGYDLYNSNEQIHHKMKDKVLKLFTALVLLGIGMQEAKADFRLVEQTDEYSVYVDRETWTALYRLSSGASGSVTIPSTFTIDLYDPNKNTFGNHNLDYYKGTYTVTSVDGYKTNVSSITLPSSVKIIYGLGFGYSTNLTSINLEHVEEMGSSQFAGCTNLKSIKLSAIKTCRNAFGGSGLTKVTLSGVNIIPEAAFSGCENLTDINLSSVTEIQKSAFYGCSKLSSVSFNSIRKIGDYGFSGTGFTSLTIPGNIELGHECFAGCENLTSVTMQSGRISMGRFTFAGCESLNSITLPNGLTEIGEGCFYKCNFSTITIPGTVKSIGERAFDSCLKLTSIAIPNNTTSIGEYAFRGCSYLNSIDVPNSVTSLGANAFMWCTSLRTAKIGDGVRTINNSLFYDCQELKSVDIGENITSISDYAFYNCVNVDDFTCRAENPPSTTTTSLAGIRRSSATLHVHIGSKSAYRETYPWSDFGSIVSLNQDGPDDGPGHQGGSGASGDLNGDGTIDGADIVLLVNKVLGISTARSKVTRGTSGATSSTTRISANPFEIRAGESKELVINLENPEQEVTLVQMDIQLPKGLSLNRTGGEYRMDMGTRSTRNSHWLAAHDNGKTTRLLLGSNRNELIDGTEGSIVKLELTASKDFQGGNLQLMDMLCVSPNLITTRPSDYAILLSASDATDIDGIGTDRSTDDIYDMHGTRLSRPQKGINIINGKKVVAN